MDFLLSIFILAVENPTNIPSTGSSKDWYPLWGALGVTVITAFANLWKNRSKGQQDKFKVFMDESAEFRTELRNERDRLKKDLENLELEKKISLEKISNCEQNYKDHDIEVKRYITQLDTANKEIETLTLKISGLKERVVTESDAKLDGKI